MKKRKQNSIPKDLGIKIGSPAEVLWTRVKDRLKKQIEDDEKELIVSREFLQVSESMVAREQVK